jgi:hypothetical protein
VQPILILNPRADQEFAERARALLASGVDQPIQLQAALRRHYPHAVVRARDLSGESAVVWYVYRDGHWVS